MSGQDRVHLKTAQQSRAAIRADGLGERDHRGGQGLAHRRGPGVPLTQSPDALVLLGQVGQVKIDREGAGHRLGPRQRPAGDQRRDVGVRSRRGACTPRSGACPRRPASFRGRTSFRLRGGIRSVGSVRRVVQARGDHPPPQVLDVSEQAVAIGLRDHLTENLAEHPDVLPHRSRNPPGVGVPAAGRHGHRASVIGTPAVPGSRCSDVNSRL